MKAFPTHVLEWLITGPWCLVSHEGLHSGHPTEGESFHRLRYESDTSEILIMLAKGKQDEARLGLVHRQNPDAMQD